MSGRAPELLAYPRGARELSPGFPSRSCPAGLWSPRRDPAREDAPAGTTPQRFAPNSPTRRLSQSSRGRGSRGGAGRTIAAGRGKPSAPGPCGARENQQEPREDWGSRRAALGSRPAGGRRGARGSAGLGGGGGESLPPPPWQQCGGRARLPGWRAAEVPRSWSGAGAAAASRRRAAAAAGRTGGRAELGGGAARPAGRGGADRPR